MYKKLVLIFIAALSVTIFFVVRTVNKKDSFSLVEQMEERQVMGVFNLTQLINDGKSIGQKLKTFGLAEMYFDQVAETLKNSGLRLDKVYYSLETRQTFKRSIYFEIIDQKSLRSTVNDFTSFYYMEQDSLDTSIYFSEEYNIALRIEKDWLEIIQGDISDLEQHLGISNTAKQLLEKEHFFILNPTKNKQFDSLEYIFGNYDYDSILTISGEWYCNRSNDHPVQIANEKIAYYPTDENVISAFLNVDRTRWEEYKNEYLQERLESAYSNGMFDYPSMSEHWMGQFAFNFGGKKEHITTKIVTEFDENFNQIERKVTETDSIRDVGFVFSTNDAVKLHKELLNQSNIEEKKGDTYIALLPPLKPQYSDERLLLSTAEKEIEIREVNEVMNFDFQSSQLDATFSANTKQNTLYFNFQLIPKVSGKVKFDEILNVFL